jgi:hypothetical protein
MDGQSVSVLGEISAVSQLFTKEHKPFVKAVIEDISGSIETMVWPRIYDADRALWQEGTVVVIEGKVRVRDEAVQLNCDRAKRYVPAPPADGALAPAEAELSGPSVESDYAEAEVTHSGFPEPIGALQPAAVPAPPVRRHRLIISLGETENAGDDILRLHEVVDALKQYRGGDEVSLRLGSNGSTTMAKLPVSTSYCPELQAKLAGLVGDSAVRVEDVPS